MKLDRTFGLWSAVSIVIGGIIGSGIFMKPALMASQVGSPLLLIGIWVFAGVLTLLGALSNAEVAAMMPETGGQYVFFQKMYGDFIAFLYGWAAFAVFNTAGVASIAYIFATYAEYFVKLPRLSADAEKIVYLFIPGIGRIYPFENLGVKSLTILVIGGLTLVNYRSTRSGGKLQVVFTALKIAAIAFLIVGLLFSPNGSAHNIVTPSTTHHLTGWPLIIAIVAATSGAFWGYDGWNNVTFIAGEIKNPRRNIHLALLLGLTATIAVYGLLNLAFVYMLPIDRIASSNLVASDAATVAFGYIGGGLIAAMVIVSTFGTTNGNILATARVSFAMALEKRFFSWTGVVHPRFHTPGNALVLHALWTSLLVLSGSFDMLTDMLVFVSWLFYGLSAFGVFILRRKMPDAERPYRVWGYPFVPALFVIATVIFLVLTLFHDINDYWAGRTPLINSLFGLLLTALGIPLYWYFRRVNK